MVVDFVGEAGVSCAVYTIHGADIERFSIWENDTLPSHQDPGLAAKTTLWL